jgi:hypothetical protein
VVAVFATDPDINFTWCRIYRSLAIHLDDRYKLSPGLFYNSCTLAQSQYIEGDITNESISIASGNFIAHQNGKASQGYKIYLTTLVTHSLPYYRLNASQSLCLNYSHKDNIIDGTNVLAKNGSSPLWAFHLVDRRFFTVYTQRNNKRKGQ